MVEPPLTGWEETACPACAGARAAPIWEEDLDADARRVSGAERARVVRCEACGFCFTNPRPSADILRRYYALVTDGSSAADEGTLSRRGTFEAGLRLIRRLAPGPRVLDVGCWTGEFLRVARTAGFAVRGVEINPVLAEYARSRHGLDVVTGDFAALPVEPGSADAVTLWDVLEHLRDPRDSIRHAARALAPGGVVVVVSPNIQFHIAKARLLRRAGRATAISGIAHLNHFSEATLAGLLGREGLRTVYRGVAPAHLRGRGLENAGRRAYVTLARAVRGLTGINVSNSLLLVGRKEA